MDWNAIMAKSQQQPVDLLAQVNGGLGLMASNAHYGTPQNMLGIGRAVNMGDGWETARNPNRPPMFKMDANGMMELPGFDWCCLQLGAPGVPDILEIDTLHFKGNYPESFMAEWCFNPTATRTTWDPSSHASQPAIAPKAISRECACNVCKPMSPDRFV